MLCLVALWSAESQSGIESTCASRSRILLFPGDDWLMFSEESEKNLREVLRNLKAGHWRQWILGSDMV
jgi:hypothetical protein